MGQLFKSSNILRKLDKLSLYINDFRSNLYKFSFLAKINEHPIKGGIYLKKYNFWMKQSIWTKTNYKKLNPGYISGFIDGKGSFIASISADSTCKSGYRLKLTFQIGLHKKDKVLLELIKEFFGVGQITELNFKSFQYRVSSLEGLKVIIEHLDKYPLLTEKFADYQLFKQIFKLMLENQHLTSQGLKKILLIKNLLNKGLSKKLKIAFPDVDTTTNNIICIPHVENKQIYDLNWLAGFIIRGGAPPPPQGRGTCGPGWDPPRWKQRVVFL